MTSTNTKKSDPYPYDQLMQALYWIWDAFDRCLMTCFLVYGTAECAIHNKEIEGDKICVGVRKMEWKSGATPVLLAFTGDPIEKTEKYVVFKNPFNAVPVYVYLFDDHPTVTSPNQIFYQREYFKVPNPYQAFLDHFHE